jgi:hypothetical protein
MPKQRRRSADPVQEKLRSDKDSWNKQTSALISKIIEFKRGLNGKPSGDIPASSIKDPLPSQVGGAISQLSSEFQELVSGAQQIISEQGNYSNTRKKKQPKKPNSPAPQKPPVEVGGGIEQALSKLNYSQYEMIKEASMLGNFWQFFSSLFSKKEYNKQRVGMLRLAEYSLYNISEFENEILKLNINSVPNAIVKYQTIKYSFESLQKSLLYFVSIKEQRETEKEKERIKAEKNKEGGGSTGEGENQEGGGFPGIGGNHSQDKNSPALEKIKFNMHTISNLGMDKNKIMQLQTLISDYASEKDEQTKDMIYDRVVDLYKHTLVDFYNKVREDTGETVSSLEGAISALQKKSENINEKIEKRAANSISRFMKRQLIKALKFNRAAPFRLEISNSLDDIKKHLKDIVKSLQKDIEVKEIDASLKEIKVLFEEIKSPIGILNSMYRQEFYKRDKKKNRGSGKKKPGDDLFDYNYRRNFHKNMDDLF